MQTLATICACVIGLVLTGTIALFVATYNRRFCDWWG